jgi:hypothetical protein
VSFVSLLERDICDPYPIQDINLPVGAVAVAFVTFFLPARPPFGAVAANVSIWRRLLAMDWIGTWFDFVHEESILTHLF